jgi:hypothetical protein
MASSLHELLLRPRGAAQLRHTAACLCGLASQTESRTPSFALSLSSFDLVARRVSCLEKKNAVFDADALIGDGGFCFRLCSTAEVQPVSMSGGTEQL